MFASGQGQFRYRECLKTANNNNQVGPHHHMRLPTPPTSRLGFAGKKVSKKDRAAIADRLLEQSLNNPTLRAAALNMARFLRLK